MLEFEKMHKETYRDLGFELIEVPTTGPADWAELVCRVAAARPTDMGAY
jgi:predicted ATPase